MIKFFVKKISEGAVNPDTGEAWKVEDVPKLWRASVIRELKKAEEK